MNKRIKDNLFNGDEKKKVEEFCEMKNQEMLDEYDEYDEYDDYEDFKELYKEVKKIARKHDARISIPQTPNVSESKLNKHLTIPPPPPIEAADNTK